MVEFSGEFFFFSSARRDSYETDAVIPPAESTTAPDRDRAVTDRSVSIARSIGDGNTRYRAVSRGRVG